VNRTPITDGNGEKIEVMLAGEKVFEVNPVDGLGSYKDLKGTTLFVDYGTSAGKRTMKLFDIPSKREIFKTDYTGEVSTGKNTFVFDSFIDEKPDWKKCSNYKEIKAMGGSINYLQKMSLDIATQQLTPTGSPFCAYGE